VHELDAELFYVIDGSGTVVTGGKLTGETRTNAENLRGLWQPDEERLLREVTDTITKHEGRPPRGWMGAGAL
jgi:hypothetical protein